MKAKDILANALEVNGGVTTTDPINRLARIHKVSKEELREAFKDLGYQFDKFNGLTYIFADADKFEQFKNYLVPELSAPAETFDDIDRFLGMEL